MENLQIYKASAGSGKTHLLTQNYLKLAFANPHSFSKILAVTFTNKASEEMKTRIIEEIDNIIKQGKNAAHFEEIEKYLLHCSEQEIVEKAQEIRDNILHNYSMFSVSTIDSFVQKVIRSFAFEIGIPSTYTIELDSSIVIEDLTNMLLNNVGNDIDLQNRLVRFAYFKISEGLNWNLRGDIGKLAVEIFKEKFESFQINEQNTSKEDIQTQRAALLNELLKSVQIIIKDFEKGMLEISKDYSSIIQNANIAPDDLGKNFKTLHNYMSAKIPAKNYNPYETKTIPNLPDSLENWYAKSAKSNVISDIESVFTAVNSCLKKVINLYDLKHTDYYSAKSILSNFHSFGILSNLAELLPEYRNENDLLLMSDTTILLKEIIGNNDAPYIYEKIGSKYNYILIDEFQDTSEFQWSNFKPLIENGLAEGLYNLIVGDIKQSIYRWRGGNWRLLLDGVKKDIGEHLISEKSLDTNWRSKQNIIDFNNSFFKIAPEILQDSYNLEIADINDISVLAELRKENFDSILKQAYKDSFQELPKISGKKGGRVQIEFIDSKKTESGWQKEAGFRTGQTIDFLLKNKNYEPRDITILVRKNKEGKQIVEDLLQYQNENPETVEKYSIISADSLFIDSSPAVKIIINAMKYLYDQRNTISFSILKYHYFKLKNKENTNFHQIFEPEEFNSVLEEFLPENFLKNKTELKKKSLFEQTEAIISIFKLDEEPASFQYIQAFQDAVLDYSSNNPAELSSFLNWWDTKGKNISVQLSDKLNALKIMTIHKSKGLAFKVVIIPYCDWNTDHSGFNAPVIWAKTDQEIFPGFEYLPVQYKSELAKTIFRKDYFNEKLFANMDAINMLYVAFTRPKEELIIFTSGNDKLENINNVSKILQKAVTINSIGDDKNSYKLLKTNFDETKSVFLSDYGYLKIDNEKFLKTDLGNNFVIDKYPNSKPEDKISINFSSEDFLIESIDFINDKVKYGTLMHKIFAEIKTLDDIDSVILDLYYKGYLSQEERTEIKHEIQTITKVEEVKRWFHVNSENVFTEKAILSEKGNIRIPDRVIKTDLGFEVIDFKFGEQRPEHENQIKEYMELISKIYPTEKIKGHLYYVQDKICKTFQ